MVTHGNRECRPFSNQGLTNLSVTLGNERFDDLALDRKRGRRLQQRQQELAHGRSITQLLAAYQISPTTGMEVEEILQFEFSKL